MPQQAIGPVSRKTSLGQHGVAADLPIGRLVSVFRPTGDSGIVSMFMPRKRTPILDLRLRFCGSLLHVRAAGYGCTQDGELGRCGILSWFSRANSYFKASRLGISPLFRLVLLILFGLGVASNASADVRVEKVEYKGWRNCYRVSNGEVELIVTGDVGPRVIRFGFIGGENVFKEFAEQLGKSNEDKFQLRGGDRVWKAPEDPIATWVPDNLPVEMTITANGLIATAPVEPPTLLQKEIEVRMANSGTDVTVIHRLTNRSLFPLEYSVWSLTMMAPGGISITGFPPRGRHPANLEATNPLVMWAYTNLADKRWVFTKKYMALKQDPNNTEAQKIGLFNADTWGAYVLNNEVFVKRTQANPGEAYPDFGCSYEEFTNNEFLEIETLGPLTKVLSGKTVEHVEHWSLHRDVQLTELTDEAIDRTILPLLRPGAGAN